MAEHSRRTGRARVNVDSPDRKRVPPPREPRRERREFAPPGALGSLVAPAPKVERVTTVGGSVRLDPSASVSIVSAERIFGEALSYLTINLPDGTVDGFQKSIVFRSSDMLEEDVYRLFAQFESVPVCGSLNFPGAGGGAVLVWDASDRLWLTAGVYLSST